MTPRVPRVVIAGLGDTGVLTAVHLGHRRRRRGVDLVGVSVTPGLVSGQELGLRLARPDQWARDYRIGYHRFRGLDRASVLHGSLVGLDTDAREVRVRGTDGEVRREPYDVLVIATGVSNGFWRTDALLDDDGIDAGLHAAHERLASASSVAIVGGGAAAIGSAAQVAATWPDKQVDLYFPGDRALPHHHPRVWRRVEGRLAALAVARHPGHRAEVPDGPGAEQITTGPVAFSTGQPPATAEAVLWAIGRVRPHTGWLPAEMLDERGFVRVEADLGVSGFPGVFAVGDVAATDPLRTSARNNGGQLLARNVAAHLEGRPLRPYRPPRGRWGSVLGAEADGLRVFAPDGRVFRIPAWLVDRVLQPWIVRVGFYRGVRRS